jgi:hypothetical protein
MTTATATRTSDSLQRFGALVGFQAGMPYALWSRVRLTPELRWVDMLITYPDCQNGRQTELFFEDIPTLMRTLARHP